MVRVNKEYKQIQKALAALDTAVQKWYESNAPLNKERYASCHIRTCCDGTHYSNITLLPDSDTNNYFDIASSKECSRLKEYLKKEKRNNERNTKKSD